MARRDDGAGHDGDAAYGRQRPRLAAALDEEMARLPERLRVPLVLCYLDGRTRDEAAAALGWSLGTLKRRLEQGKAVLHARLTRRGVGLPLAALTAALAETGAGAAVPVTLCATVGRAAVAFVDGTLGPTTPALLAQGVLNAMSWTPTKIAAALLVAGTLSAGVGLAVRTPAPDDPAPKQPAPAAARADRFGDPLPDGAAVRLGTLAWRARAGVHQVAFSRDGSFAVGGTNDGVQFWDAATGRPLDRPGFDRERRVTTTAVALSPDGKLLATGAGTRLLISTVRLWDLATGRELPFEKQDAEILELTFAPDGKTLAGRPSAGPGGRSSAGPDVWLWEVPSGRLVAKLNHKEAGDPPDVQTVRWLQFSPDGKSLHTASYRKTEVRIWDTATGKPIRSVPTPGEGRNTGLALSPDVRHLLRPPPATSHFSTPRPAARWDASRPKPRATTHSPTWTAARSSSRGRPKRSTSSTRWPENGWCLWQGRTSTPGVAYSSLRPAAKSRSRSRTATASASGTRPVPAG